MKNWIIAIVILVVIAMIGGCSYNGMVKSDEEVKGKWGQVETQYQRRSDLIPNLVSTVKGEANFEKSTITAVTEARAKATSIQVDPTKLTPEAIQQYQQAQGQLSTALGRLLVASENYPNLKANEAFRNLQVQLEGTENRISVARRDFNDAVQAYNSKVRAFPTNIMAGIFGFPAKGYFQAEAGSDKAPKVQF
ncbi:LemA family protein [Mucilaginibacter achroorhodeus]|uniref:LemA family protein n=1 Tax=Mucilaginibacter achroorhodeus TaxID=2599294 RepID=A0A563UAT7_9SPHI|nr:MULTISPECIES: LemA family protein [Mucilaginibacter]QXV66421.1 LemA family protein [Mucilaginibacter sp. 21P]TWR28458.1 LemA family protein [Mucilaginibacter achroorhodeus]